MRYVILYLVYNLDLDLDSPRNLHPPGHIGPHSDAIRVCQELPPLLPPRWTPSLLGLCWLYSSSSLLVDLVLSCILVPASTVLAVVCGDALVVHTENMSKPAKSSFSQYMLSNECPLFAVQFWFWPLLTTVGYNFTRIICHKLLQNRTAEKILWTKLKRVQHSWTNLQYGKFIIILWAIFWVIYC